jgi:hypothetical protein
MLTLRCRYCHRVAGVAARRRLIHQWVVGAL